MATPNDAPNADSGGKPRWGEKWETFSRIFAAIVIPLVLAFRNWNPSPRSMTTQNPAPSHQPLEKPMPSTQTASKDKKPKPFDWTHWDTVMKPIVSTMNAIVLLFTIFTSSLVILLFIFSCLYVGSIQKALSFSLLPYIDVIDYVQVLTIPLTLYVAYDATVAGVVFFSILLLAVAPYLFRLFRLLNFLVLSVLWILILVLVISKFFLAASNAGDKLDLPHKQNSTVFRMGEPCPTKGVIFFRTGRYIFLWMREDNSVLAIPNAELQMIKITPHSPLVNYPSPSSSTSPQPLSTPSQQSPTPR